MRRARRRAARRRRRRRKGGGGARIARARMPSRPRRVREAPRRPRRPRGRAARRCSRRAGRRRAWRAASSGSTRNWHGARFFVQIGEALRICFARRLLQRDLGRRPRGGIAASPTATRNACARRAPSRSRTRRAAEVKRARANADAAQAHWIEPPPVLASEFSAADDEWTMTKPRCWTSSKNERFIAISERVPGRPDDGSVRSRSSRGAHRIIARANCARRRRRSELSLQEDCCCSAAIIARATPHPRSRSKRCLARSLLRGRAVWSTVQVTVDGTASTASFGEKQAARLSMRHSAITTTANSATFRSSSTPSSTCATC